VFCGRIKQEDGEMITLWYIAIIQVKNLYKWVIYLSRIIFITNKN